MLRRIEVAVIADTIFPVLVYVCKRADLILNSLYMFWRYINTWAISMQCNAVNKAEYVYEIE